jgi:hypothetical protein
VATEETGHGDGRASLGRVARLLDRARERLAGVERELWLLALLALVGDLALTVYGLERGLAEANPVARVALAAHGYAALVAMKAGALSVGVGGWLLLPRRHRSVVPLALAMPWTLAVLVNAATLTLAG